ncbi:hypothetical protein [Nocardia crassostreae]|uniref:hypothetical protein n=1 Tax=Nocardia crassostreae TaxID=53428 RepID=UPI000830A6DA|nr:hypothetical protein [Nocardia crassostreae]
MPRPRRIVRILSTTAAAVLFALAGPGATPASADPYPDPQPPDPTYPFAQVLTLLEGTVRDATAPGMLDYFVKAGIMTSAGQIAQPFLEFTKPDIYGTTEGQTQALVGAQRIWDALTHTPPFSLGFPPHPDYLPDWNRNGKFGIEDTAGQVLIAGDSDAMVDDNYSDAAFQDANFRYPCLNSDGSVFYETLEGGCAAADSGSEFKLGTVRKFKVVNSRGIPLAGKVWMPHGAEESDQRYPVAIGLPGAAESQTDIGMYAQSAARAGYMSFTFSQAGQPGSEGNALDLVLPLLTVEDCFAPGSCRDAQDVTRWVFGEDITPVVDLGNELGNLLTGQVPRLVRSNPYYEPVGHNTRNPWLGMLDLEHVNLWGQSVGSIGVTNYLNWQDKGHGIDGRPLLRVSSVVGMSGFAGIRPASAPLQMQTADLDIPVPSGNFTNFYQPFFNPTDGPFGTKDRYDNLLRSGRSQPVQLIVYEAGSHGDSINWVGVPRNLRSPKLSVHYFLNWFDCYGKGTGDTEAACGALLEAQPGLSRAVATEYAPDGSAGPSYCLTIPDRATLGQIIRPEVFIQNLTGPGKYDCVRKS